jgi:hypothetical protein
VHVTNLAYLLELRHEIEHRSTGRIDDAVSAKLQACCINFNDAIKGLFGAQYALERRLPIALQFVTFSPDQRALLKKASTLPRHVETMMGTFERQLTPEQQADPRFAFRVFMVHRTANRAPHTKQEFLPSRENRLKAQECKGVRKLALFGLLPAERRLPCKIASENLIGSVFLAGY